MKVSPSKQLMVMIGAGVGMIIVVAIFTSLVGTGLGMLIGGLLRSSVNNWDVLDKFILKMHLPPTAVAANVDTIISVIGGVAGAIYGARAACLWVESRLLYHPKTYRREIRDNAALDLSGQPYVLEKVSYSLPARYSGRTCSRGELAQVSYLLRPRVKQGNSSFGVCPQCLREWKLPEPPDLLCPACNVRVNLKTSSQLKEVSTLWVVFCANAMNAIDWLQFCHAVLSKSRNGQDNGEMQGEQAGNQRSSSKGSSHSAGNAKEAGVAFLLFDYPGYGVNQGRPAPDSIAEASQRALSAALKRIPEGRPEVNLLGHSLGAACAAQFAVKLANDGNPTGRLVMSAPFLSIPHVLMHWACEFAKQRASACGKYTAWVFLNCGRYPLLGLLMLIMPHRWGNTSNVRAAIRAGWTLGIMHGVRDHMVPVVMGRELHLRASKVASAASRSPVTYVEVPQADHNDMLNEAVMDYARLMGLMAPTETSTNI